MMADHCQMAPFHIKFQMEDSWSLKYPRGEAADSAAMRTAQIVTTELFRA